MNNPINHILSVLCLIIILLMAPLHAQPVANACRIERPPQIDGHADDSVWRDCSPIKGFQTYKPYHGRPVAYPTRFRMAYDNRGIYILAELYDPYPDSILRQLGNRDDELNADYIGVGFDTYRNQGDAYYFQLYASGVQKDYRRSDATYDAVWKSAVMITDSGWVAEMSIPYSAIRFPANTEQEWGIQFYRYIRRSRELSQWALEDKSTGNELTYWGIASGIKDIDAPLRLSLTPFAAFVRQYQPTSETQSRTTQSTFSGGLDIKYGLSEAFTLDMTLLPDFSQVRSDNYIKNLSAYETVYDENRPFFSEGVELFKRGNLFYSRRIGREPAQRSSLASSIKPGEEILENPDRVKLINAFKISGRNKNGLALGVFNAVTGHADAVIRDTLGIDRKVKTEPLANYNILVVDQQFKGNTALYLINTNVMRDGQGKDANVTAGGATLSNPTNTYEISASGALSTISDPSEKPGKDPGFRYTLGLARTKGRIHFSIQHNRTSKEFDINDMGLIHRTGLEDNTVWLSYRLYEPFGPFLEMRNSLEYNQTLNLDNRTNENTNINYSGYTTLRNYLSLWWGINFSPFDRYDTYEPRASNRVFIRPGYFNGNVSFSSDYRKAFALDGRVYQAKDFDTYRETSFNLTPIFRLNNRFSFNLAFTYSEHQGVRAYVQSLNDNQILFGERSMNTYVNSISARYMFKADLSLALWVRHYWQEGWYQDFFLLRADGHLSPVEHLGNHDYNFNSMNMDLACSWVFAPGSLLSVVWKSALLEENSDLVTNYLTNFRNVMEKPQAGLWSIRFVYYLDHAMLKQS